MGKNDWLKTMFTGVALGATGLILGKVKTEKTEQIISGVNEIEVLEPSALLQWYRENILKIDGKPETVHVPDSAIYS